MVVARLCDHPCGPGRHFAARLQHYVHERHQASPKFSHPVISPLQL